MLQINFIRQNPELVKERLAVRNFANIRVVDELLKLDEEIRKQKSATENLQAFINNTSKEIGMLMGKGEKALAEEKKLEVAANKEKLNTERVSLASLETTFNQQILTLP